MFFLTISPKFISVPYSYAESIREVAYLNPADLRQDTVVSVQSRSWGQQLSNKNAIQSVSITSYFEYLLV